MVVCGGGVWWCAVVVWWWCGGGVCGTDDGKANMSSTDMNA